MRAPRLALLVLAAGLGIGAAPVASLEVTLGSVRSDTGVLRLCLTADPGNFPSCVDDADAITRTVPAATRSVRFGTLAAGGYAVAVIHDENSNAKLDTFAGIPREGFGFSRNPAIRFGPPRFAAARFDHAGDAQVQQVRLRYIL